MNQGSGEQGGGRTQGCVGFPSTSQLPGDVLSHLQGQADLGACIGIAGLCSPLQGPVLMYTSLYRLPSYPFIGTSYREKGLFSLHSLTKARGLTLIGLTCALCPFLLSLQQLLVWALEGSWTRPCHMTILDSEITGPKSLEGCKYKWCKPKEEKCQQGKI